MTTGKYFGMRFKLRKLLGKGSLGHTFLADDGAQGGTLVALKILHQKLNTRPGFTASFITSATAAQALHHPLIRRVLDCGKLDGHLYYTQDFKEGLTLRNWLSQQRILKDRVLGGLPKLIKILSAIQVLHERGLYAFLKPENLFLIGDSVQICDYWLAPLIPPSEFVNQPEAQKYLPYLAPEVKADWSNLSRQSDYYTIGIILHEILTGTLPEREALIPSLFSSDFGKETDLLLAKALSSDSIQRFRSTEEFIRSLEYIYKHLHRTLPINSSLVEKAPESIDFSTFVQPPSSPPTTLTQTLEVLKVDATTTPLYPTTELPSLNTSLNLAQESITQVSQSFTDQTDLTQLANTHQLNPSHFSNALNKDPVQKVQFDFEPELTTQRARENFPPPVPPSITIESESAILKGKWDIPTNYSESIPVEDVQEIVPDPLASAREEREQASNREKLLSQKQNLSFSPSRESGWPDLVARFRESPLPFVFLLGGVLILLLLIILAVF